MELKSYSSLSATQLAEIEQFINSNNFNSGISFLENDMNFYENFPCFYMLYEEKELVATLSVFIPDAASCEIYFHMADDLVSSSCDLFQLIYSELKYYLDKFHLYNQYIIMENGTTDAGSLQTHFNLNFSHSEYLMQYNISHIWNNIPDSLDYEIGDNDTCLTLDTFLGDDYVGSCQVETSGDYALIHDVEVAMAYRGFGYGRETLYHTVNHLKENGYSKILLHVNSANTIAFTMYSHHGFNIKQQLDYWRL